MFLSPIIAHMPRNADIDITIWSAVCDRFHWVGAIGCLPGQKYVAVPDMLR